LLISFVVVFVVCFFSSCCLVFFFLFFFSSRRRHTRFSRDWSSDVCSSDLKFGKLHIGLPAQDPCYSASSSSAIPILLTPSSQASSRKEASSSAEGKGAFCKASTNSR